MKPFNLKEYLEHPDWKVVTMNGDAKWKVISEEDTWNSKKDMAVHLNQMPMTQLDML